MTEQTFVTIVRNERKDRGLALWDRHGGSLGILPPQCSRALETFSPDTPYSPFSKVTYRQDGEILLTENSEWPKPEGHWLATLLNKSGGEIERRIVGHQEVILLRGIPKIISLPAHDDHAIHSRMEILRIQTRIEGEENASFPEYVLWRPVLKDVWTECSPEELQELEAELTRLSEGGNA